MKVRTILITSFLLLITIELVNTDNQTKTDSDGISSCHDLNPTPDCSKAGNGYAKITYLGK